MAAASQKMTLMRFLEVMRGSLIAAPSRLLPVTKIPLHDSARNPAESRREGSGPSALSFCPRAVPLDG